MKRLIFKWFLNLAACVCIPVQAQIIDQATLPVLTNDMFRQTQRLAEISVIQRFEAEQQEDLARFTEYWAVMNDSIQEGLRSFGKGYPVDGLDSLNVRQDSFEYFWLSKGLWKEIRLMVDLYGEYLSEFEKMTFVTNALQSETTDVFITQGYNTIEVFNNMMGIIRDRLSANPQMSLRQCYTKGEDMKRQVTSINAALKWQLRRVYEFSLMNNNLDPFRRTEPDVKEDFDPAKYNK